MIAPHERHLLRARHLVAQLRATGRDQQRVIAVLLTETFFRDDLWRCLEYAAWLFLGAFWTSRAQRLSVGIAQIQVQHWIRLGFLSTARWSPGALATVMSAEANYDACAALLREAGTLESSFRRIAATYRGEARLYHVATLTWFGRAADAFPRFPRSGFRAPGA